MKRRNATRNALFTSVFALLMCVSMLVGTTFAWFTDTSTTGSNVIQSGKLDIVLEYWDGDSWENAEGHVLEFQKGGNYHGYVGDVLWEPGCTYELPKIRVRNEGNLAAYVVLRVDGITGDEKLLEAIELKTRITNMPESVLTGSMSTQLSQFNNATVDLMYGTPDGTIIFDWSLMAKGHTSLNSGHTDTSPEFTISGHMKEEAGNEYQDLKIEGVSITALAKQEVYEYDSFSRKYDKNAALPTVTVVNTVDALNAALANGANVSLTSSISTEATITAPYGNKTAVVHNGTVLNGNGNTLGITNGGDNYVVMTSGGTIKNLTIDDGFRGIMIMYPTQDIVLNDVTVSGDVCYALNTGEGDGTKALIVTNSTLNGWTSIGTAVKTTTFTNCTFGQGSYYTNVSGRLVKPYVDTVFENCEFNSLFYIDLSQLGKDGDGNVLNENSKITLKNCTVNGVKLTAENWKNLIVPESDCAEGQISIELKDGTYLSANNIVDYIIIE